MGELGRDATTFCYEEVQGEGAGGAWPQLHAVLKSGQDGSSRGAHDGSPPLEAFVYSPFRGGFL